MRRAGALLMWLTITMSPAGCGGGAPVPVATTAAATVSNPVAEAALTTLTLTSDAQRRLGIETTFVEQRAMSGMRVLGGEILPEGGAQTTVTAPVTGTLDSETVPPEVGAELAKGQTVLTLVPLAPAERDGRIEAERVVAEAVGRQEMAAKRSERARQLTRDGSGSRRAAEEAQADLAVADAALKAARDRLTLAARAVSASGAIRLEAPHAALLRTLHATPGQNVAAGAPLFDLVKLEALWVRVPLYAGDIEAVDRQASVHLVMLGASSGMPGRAATPVAAPPSADATTAGVDLFYRVANRDRSLRPGQRVSVRVPLRSRHARLVVPHSTILFDAFGGAWLYEAREGGVFVRRRVSLVDVVGETAVLQQGPAVGTRVVTIGAAELFGTEFGVGK